MDAVRRPYIVAVSGVKNSGKTTFLEKLIGELTMRGHRIAVVKHDGHDFQGDVERTDTYRLRQAGAYGCGIFSASKWMVIKEQSGVSEQRLIEEFPEADIILLEGLKNSTYPKFEVIRKKVSNESICNKESLLGIITDSTVEIAGVPKLGFEEISLCADMIEEEMRKES